ncbi:amino acid lyase, partial [Salmonella enterica subsp. enterica serovar Enteritidis]|nr:amino acid lyase [Salmonella enterica subsp. enterica serovar Enteritidis]
VWLVGDSAPPDPAALSARLAELAGGGSVRDGYLNGGAVEALEKAFAAHLGKEACAFFPTGTLANTVALRVLCGDAPHALCQYDSHLYRDESNMAQRLAGINLV